jgi:1-acyl-sn-glycerol-3-phosphate acyltransferase
MKIIKEILGRVFALWAIITFILTFLVIFIPSMITWLIPNPAGQGFFIWLARLWMNIWLLLVGCPLRVFGRKNFKKGETYIVTCNHNSLMDVPLSCPFIPGANKTIAKASFVKVPLFGFYYAKGSVLVNRKSDESRRQSFDKMKAVLKGNMHMSVYPEGTRNRTNEPLKKFHDGAFKLSVDTGNAIIPCVIFNTKKVLPANKTFYFWPHQLEMHYLQSIAPQGKSSDTLKMEVFEKMKIFYTTRSEIGE